MKNFEFYTPTRVIFGRDTETKVGELIQEYGCRKVLVHFGGQSAKKSGLLDRVYASLKEHSVDYISLGGAQPNPLLSLVEKGIALCKAEGVDFILAVGGGSVIDSSKAIAYGLANDFPVWNIYGRISAPKACAPVGCIVTIAAAGSEMSDSSVITNDLDGNQKRGFSSNLCRPKFAIMNPELTYSLPAYQTASGCTDIIMHTLERWFTAHTDNSELIDGIAVSVIKTVIHNAPILLKDPHNYNARAEVMWAGSLSHNGTTDPVGDGDWGSHQLEHELGGMFNVTHGAGLAAVWPAWAHYVYKDNITRFAQLAERVFGVSLDGGQEHAALEGIRLMTEFFASINMPVTLTQLGLNLSDEQCETLAYNCTWKKTRTIGAVKKLGLEDIAAIYKAAR